MNKYDMYYDFRIATIKDVDAIMKFLKEEWGENHILANDKEFFLWQYGNEHYGDKETINFVLMLDKQRNIVGLNGFIPYASEQEERSVSSAITIVKKNLKLPMCGIELIKRFKELVPAQVYFSSGTNPKTMLPIGQQVFYYTTGIMQQYYMLNPNMKSYKIASIKNFMYLTPETSTVMLHRFDTIKDLGNCYDLKQSHKGQVYKSVEYIKKRFFEHPIYQYKVWGLIDTSIQNKCIGVLFGREQYLYNRKVLRLVDYRGNIKNLSKLGLGLQKIMIDNLYEYVDILVGNLPNEILQASGFILRKEQDENIIPTYFEPFIQKNITIYFQKSDASIVIFKADGDQDRPNSR